MGGQPLHQWRKLATAAWPAPNDPQIYGEMEIDAAAMRSYIDEVRRRTGVHVTVTHMVGKAVAHGLAAVPDLAVRISGGKVYPRESNDVFFQVSVPGSAELTGIKIVAADRKPVVEIARELERRWLAIHAGDDPEFGKTKAMLERLPIPVLRYAIKLSGWLTSGLNLDLPRFGLPRQAFGGAMVTSLGMWGVKRAYAPLAAYYRLPVIVLVGAVEEKAIVVAGQVVARPILTLCATFDHRYTDGLWAADLSRAVQEYLHDPAAFEPPLTAWEPDEELQPS